MATDGKRLFVSLLGIDAVAQVDVASLTITRMIPMSSRPADLASNAGHTILYVAEVGGDKITAHDVSQ